MLVRGIGAVEREKRLQLILEDLQSVRDVRLGNDGTGFGILGWMSDEVEEEWPRGVR